MNSNWSYSPETPNFGQTGRFLEPCHLEIWWMTLKFDGWPWKIIGHLFDAIQALCIISYPLVDSNWSYSPEMTNLGQIRRFLEPCDLEILRMTLKNNRAPLLCYFKLCAAFCSHWWIQIGVTRLAYPRPHPNHKIHDLKPYNFVPNHTIFWSNHTVLFQTIQLSF